MIQDSLPTVAATAPIEKSTKGGTPLATQKAPVQSIPLVKRGSREFNEVEAASSDGDGGASGSDASGLETLS